MSAHDQVVAALEAHGSRGSGLAWQCPAHDDTHASLSVTPADDRVLVHCHTGCDTLDVLDALGLDWAALFDEPATGRGWSTGTLRRLGASSNGDGRVHLGNVRYLPGAREGEVKALAAKGSRRDLWPAPETVPGDVLYVVEGEPDAVTAAEVGLPAVAVPGAAKWSPAWAARIATGRSRVVVITDSDTAGRKAAAKWAGAISEHCQDVRVLDLAPDRSDGHDLGDYFRDAVTEEDRAAAKWAVERAAAHLSSYLGTLGTTGKTTSPQTAAQSQNHVSYPPSAGKTSKTFPKTTPETAAQSQNGASYPGSGVPDRYAGRLVDLDALLAQPPKPIPWRVRDVVADGTLTVISGESGAGKSWLAQAMCTAVARGGDVAGLPCVKGTALYVDAEMGPAMFVDQRLRPAGVTKAEFRYIDAMGLDISTPHDLAWIRDQIEQAGANFVVIDSLRRLTPSKAENDSDDMAPAIAALAKLARDTGAAIVLVHHKGDSDKFYRGSTAIRDQADALFGLLRDPDDEHAPRRLTCRGPRAKMRYSIESPDVYLEISPEEGGVAESDPPEDPGPQVPVRDAVAQAIKAALPAKTKAEVAVKVGRKRNDVTLATVWRELEESGEIRKITGHWMVSSYLESLEGDGKTTSGEVTS